MQSFSWTGSKTVNSGTRDSITITITVPSGYTFIGIVGITGSGNAQLSIAEFNVSSSAVTVYYQNNTSTQATLTAYTARCLFVKSSFI